MLADKEQSFNILRGNVFQFKILCMAKLSRTKQWLLRHPYFKNGVLPQKWKIKKQQQPITKQKADTMRFRRWKSQHRERQKGFASWWQRCPWWRPCNSSKEHLFRWEQGAGGIYRGKKNGDYLIYLIVMRIVLQLGQCLAWTSDWCPEK